MAEPILTVEHLIKAYGETPVLDDISFAVKPGEVIVVVGPSGCGKSTLLRCLNGLEPTQSGRVRLGNETVAYGGKNLTQLRQRIGMVFQSYELFPHMTVLANVLPLIFDGVTATLPVFLQGIFDPNVIFDASTKEGIEQVGKYVIDGTIQNGSVVGGVVTWGYLLPFFLSNLIANIYGFYQNKKTT